MQAIGTYYFTQAFQFLRVVSYSRFVEREIGLDEELKNMKVPTRITREAKIIERCKFFIDLCFLIIFFEFQCIEGIISSPSYC